MTWNRVFKSQAYERPTYKHKKYPIFITDEFDFYRCVKFEDSFYGKTASELFNANLRDTEGRYASLFPGQKVSYWADSPETARAEIKKHGTVKDLLTFWAYDDASSFIPILGSDEFLKILDGRKSGIQYLIDKIDSGKALTDKEKSIMTDILLEDIDAISYDSHAIEGGENYIFLERGFKKLALRQLRLRFGRENGGGHCRIVCADTSDYMPSTKNYGYMFMPKARIVFNHEYLESVEYKTRYENECESWKRRLEGRND